MEKNGQYPKFWSLLRFSFAVDRYLIIRAISLSQCYGEDKSNKSILRRT
jgi:hypothetical protein